MHFIFALRKERTTVQHGRGSQENHLFSPEIPSRSVSFPEWEMRVREPRQPPQTFAGEMPTIEQGLHREGGNVRQTLLCRATKGFVHMGIVQGFSA